MFLGDSFVWGYDVEAEERFTEKLQARHPEWSVYNFGVSGYGTDQEYLLLKRHFDDYRPQAVFLVFCTDNDREENSWNFRYGAYKPYYISSGCQLELKGIPVPRSELVLVSEHPCLSRSHLFRLLLRAYCRVANPAPARHQDPTAEIVLELRNFVEQRGAHFVVGMQGRERHLLGLLATNHIPCVELDTTNRYPDIHHGRHWTPAGHDDVCHAIERFLLEGKYLKTAP